MSQKARKRKAKIKKVSFKDKDWYTVIAPKSFNFKPIGEILGVELSKIYYMISQMIILILALN
jgi:ribosomal protein S3AE